MAAVGLRVLQQVEQLEAEHGGPFGEEPRRAGRGAGRLGVAAVDAGRIAPGHQPIDDDRLGALDDGRERRRRGRWRASRVVTRVRAGTQRHAPLAAAVAGVEADRDIGPDAAGVGDRDRVVKNDARRAFGEVARRRGQRIRAGGEFLGVGQAVARRDHRPGRRRRSLRCPPERPGRSRLPVVVEAVGVDVQPRRERRDDDGETAGARARTGAIVVPWCRITRLARPREQRNEP